MHDGIVDMSRTDEEREYHRAWHECARRNRGVQTREQIKKVQKDRVIQQCRDIHNNKYNYKEIVYQDVKYPVAIICPIHGQFMQSLQAHRSGQGCPICAMDNRIASNKSRALISAEQFATKANKVHNGLYDYSKSAYINVHTKVEVCCSDHGPFWQTPAAHLQGQGCPHCANDRRAEFAESKGEQIITQWLDNHNVLYEKQKMFDGCVDLLSLRFDFYVPTLNLVIEFDGQQHFEFVKKFHGTRDGFERCKRRDTIKNEYAHRHKIDMLRIKYSEEKQIEKILTERILVENKLEN